MAVSSRESQYRKLVFEWIATLDRYDSDDLATHACFVLLRKHINKLAVDASRSNNPRLHFYAYVRHLEEQLVPRPAEDRLGKVAIVPAWLAVIGWVKENSFF